MREGGDVSHGGIHRYNIGMDCTVPYCIRAPTLRTHSSTRPHSPLFRAPSESSGLRNFESIHNPTRQTPADFRVHPLTSPTAAVAVLQPNYTTLTTNSTTVVLQCWTRKIDNFYFKCIFVPKAQKRVLQKVNPSKNRSKLKFSAWGTEIVPIIFRLCGKNLCAEIATI